jgi:hypothetical protein
MTNSRRSNAQVALERIVEGHFRPGSRDRGWTVSRPFYCDPKRIGAFAVVPTALSAGDDGAIFKLFVTLSMYQALRDVVIMRQQNSSSPAEMRVVADLASVSRAIAAHTCPMLATPELFEKGCDVSKHGAKADCHTRPGLRCHVKTATMVFNRMGDMGKLPTSAWLQIWKANGLQKLLREVFGLEASPKHRAALLVERFARVHRVGRKLATMFVSALSTPALAPGLTPWFPNVDGNDLVVVDTNVARCVDTLRRRDSPRTYAARERWIQEKATNMDLSTLRKDLPRYSPRMLQEALYTFSSKANRVAHSDPCAARSTPCVDCAPAQCPFGHGHKADSRQGKRARLKRRQARRPA